MTRTRNYLRIHDNIPIFCRDSPKVPRLHRNVSITWSECLASSPLRANGRRVPRPGSREEHHTSCGVWNSSWRELPRLETRRGGLREAAGPSGASGCGTRAALVVGGSGEGGLRAADSRSWGGGGGRMDLEDARASQGMSGQGRYIVFVFWDMFLGVHISFINKIYK